VTLIYHNNAGFDFDSVVGFDTDGGNLKIFLRGVNNPLVVSANDGKGQAFLAYLQSKGTLVKPPAPAPKP
jgi:hypothetical protein